MAMFPDGWMGELLAKNDIVSVVSDYLPLKSKGRTLWGLCPFHNEKTASFSVTPDKQMYYCFGCHAGGGPVQFIMAMEKLTYHEAIEHLASRAGMELPGEIDDEKLRMEREQKERFYMACREAAAYFHKSLLGDQGKQARAYLISRGLDAATIKKFGLGFSPQSWNALCKHLGELGFSEREIIISGLANKKNSDCYDIFRNRVMFPIISTNGRVIGFGARAIDKVEPKYLNTGDTPIFNKRRNLYALNMQRQQKPADLVVVEGYMDVISLYKSGIKNAVASLGTALTQQQARLMKRYVNQVYISYDGDSAGQNAALRGLDILAKEGLNVKVVVIPDGLDPDDFVKTNGADAYMSLKDDALTLNEFKLDRLASGKDLNTEDGREHYAKEACKLISKLQPVEQERYYKLVMRKTGIPVEVLKLQGGAVINQKENSFTNYRNTRDKKSQEIPSERKKLETTLLACMIKDLTVARHICSRMDPNIFSVGAFARYAQKVYEHLQKGEIPVMATVMAAMSQQDTDELAFAVHISDEIIDAEQTSNSCFKAMENKELEAKLRDISDKAAKAATPEERRELLIKMKELQQNKHDSINISKD